MSALAELQNAIATAAERSGPAIVGLGRHRPRGTGTVIAPGHVLTSAHAVRGPEPALAFACGRQATGRVLAVDVDNDLAVIEADTGEATPVEWATAPTPSIGTPVIALANPAGRGLYASLGFVAAAGRSVRGPRGRVLEGGVEHTAPLPRGSSGSPLLDLDGHLIGINAIRLEGGLILALVADAALRQRVGELAKGWSPTRRQLGVAIAPSRVARRLQRSVGLPERAGLLVRAVEGDSPAALAGVEHGDLIVSAAGQAIRDIDALYGAVDGLGDGTTLALTLVRGLDEREVELRFGAPVAEA